MVNEVYHQLNSKKCPARARRYRWGINFEFSERQNTNLAAIIVANWRVDFASSFSLCHFRAGGMSAVPDNLDPTTVISVNGVHRLRRESGVTLLMVAVGMFALLSVAILTLDVVNLYLAGNQAQKGADAAALAGAAVLSASGQRGILQLPPIAAC